MEKDSIIVVPEIEKEDHIDLQKVTDWGYNNLDHPNVIRLSMDDIYYIEYNTKIFDIINKENDSMIGPYEDSWIWDNSVKEKIKLGLLAQLKSSKKSKELYFLEAILKLIDISIQTNENMYFRF